MGSLIFSFILLAIALVGVFFAIRPPKFKPKYKTDYNGRATDREFTPTVAQKRAIARWSGVGVAVLALLLLVPSMVKQVGATEVGVPITLGQPGGSLSPGPHLTLPWTDVVTIDVKTQKIEMDDDSEVKTVTTDRVVTPIDLVVYYHVTPETAPTLLLTVGQDYEAKVVTPLARSAVYDVGSKLSSENIQSERDAYETQVENALRGVYAARGITLEKVEIKRIQLPDNIVTNAQAKINAEEQLKRAKIDAETKVVQATAQAEANKIIAESARANDDASVCQLLLVQAMAEGKITGPLYINPCGDQSGSTPLLTRSTN